VKRLAVLVLVAAWSLPLAADEGMWTYNHFPSEKVGAAYGFTPTQEWLDHVRLSSVRLAQGCSGSIVSADGLVMTNHHCAHMCIEQLSSARKDFVKSGFYATAPKDEVKCPELEVNQLVTITDVSARLNQATAGLQDKAFNDALKAEMARIEKECATSDELRCDVVTLYHGGRYDLYTYKRYQDVRLVFAPEFDVAFFGGDPDNFMFPRYDLDVSFLRIYQGGQPAKMEHFLAWSPHGVRDGDLTFTSGHPGRTSRLFTVAELQYQRDVGIPAKLLRLAEARGILTEFQLRGPEQKRISNAMLFYVENSYKAYRGEWEALSAEDFLGRKFMYQEELRQRVMADPKLAGEYGGAWDAIEAAMQRLRQIRKPYVHLEQGLGFWSELFPIARMLVRAAEELPKPNDQRLREWSDSQLPAIKQALFSEAPIHPELEITTLAFGLTKLREDLGPDHPAVKAVFGLKSPRDLATELINGTKLRDGKLRKALFEGGQAAIEASQDPLIRFARLVDPEARAIRKLFEDEVEAVLSRNSEKIAKAQFAIQGMDTYPDATFTLRLSFGSVKGWLEGGAMVNPLTTFAGAFARHTGSEPFALPQSWLMARDKLDLDTPFNFCSTNDIVGGNSGSPVVNREAQVVGLVFDGNIWSLGGDFGFDPSNNRMVAVHSQALIEALARIYHADRLVKELRP
jgi:hypothetical protein